MNAARSGYGMLAPFRRVTSTGVLIPEIDGLRFVAILSVFIYHLAGDILRHADPAYRFSVSQGSKSFQFTQKLDFGVPLFFVISGFILALPFAQQYLRNQAPVRLAKYYLRRLTRLEPPYLLALALMFGLKVLSGQSASYLVPRLAASSFYAHNLVFAGPSLINVVAWSLEIEVQFYILAPALALIFRLAPLFRRLVLSSASIAAGTFQAALPPHHVLHLTLLGYVQYFLAGFLLADVYLTYIPCKRLHWDLVSLVGWPALAVLLGYPPALPFLGPFLVGLLYSGALYGHWTRRLFSNPIVTTIGGMCYTIYLLHNYAIAALGRFSERIIVSDVFLLRLGTQIVLVLPPVLLLSALYFLLVEKPCMKLKIEPRGTRGLGTPQALPAAQPGVCLQPDTTP